MFQRFFASYDIVEFLRFYISFFKMTRQQFCQTKEKIPS